MYSPEGRSCGVPAAWGPDGVGDGEYVSVSIRARDAIEERLLPMGKLGIRGDRENPEGHNMAHGRRIHQL